jgi:hypothetical protein
MALTADIITLAAQDGRYGYRRIAGDALGGRPSAGSCRPPWYGRMIACWRIMGGERQAVE